MTAWLKDPDEKLPYAVDWSPWLTGESDTASAVTWIVPAGIVREATPAPTLVSGKATAWFSGGTHGASYDITCRMTTTAGRIKDQTVTIMVRNR